MGLLLAWAGATAGFVIDSWEFVAVGVMLLVSLALVSVHVGAARVADYERRSRSRLGEMWGLLGLQAGVNLPALEGSAIGLEGAQVLATLVREEGPIDVVELGPGASTAIIYLAAQAAGRLVKVTALEHDDHYIGVVDELAVQLDFPHFKVIPAPLESREFSDWSGDWYSAKAVSALPEKIDLLVVDGPPNYMGGDNRYPAVPALEGRLGRGSLIYVDDTDRRSEEGMVQRWLARYPCEVARHGESFVLLRWVDSS